MAQNFRRYTANAVGITPAVLTTANSYDTLIGIYLSNLNTTASISASVYINNGTTNIYLIKSAPIPVGSALQVLDSGSKVVVQSGDVLSVVSDTASSMDVWVSAVDDIST